MPVSYYLVGLLLMLLNVLYMLWLFLSVQKNNTVIAQLLLRKQLRVFSKQIIIIHI